MEGPLLYLLSGAVVAGFIAQGTAIRLLWARIQVLERRAASDLAKITMQTEAIWRLERQNAEQAAEIALLKQQRGFA